MDVVDHQLLALLQEDAGAPLADLAAAVNLSTTPTWRRIQRLERDGVIERRVALVDPARIGLPLTVFVEIQTADHSEGWLRRFSDYIAGVPHAVEVYRMAGDVDYLLRLQVSDMTAYDGFYKALIAQVPMTRVTSRFAMECIKRTTAYPIGRSVAD